MAKHVKENDKKYYKELKKNGSTKLKLSTSKDFKLPPVLPIVFYDGITTKWTSSLNLIERTELPEVFEKYIPKFEYELVDLNKYSRDDLISLENLLSLILIVDKVRKEEDLVLLNTLPEGYLDKLKLNVPDHLLKLLADCMNLFLTKAEIEKEKIEAITEKLYQRRFNDMFDVQFSFKRAREEAKEEGRMEGKMEGIMEGIMKGKVEGAKEITIKLAKNFLKDGVPIKIISKNTGLDEDFLEQLDLDSE